MTFRSGGDTADQDNNTTNNIGMQELASAGPTALESFGTELGGPVVLVEIEGHGEKTVTVKLRCGLAIAGREL